MTMKARHGKESNAIRPETLNQATSWRPSSQPIQATPDLTTGVLQNRAQALGATPLFWFVKVYPYVLETE